MHEYKALKRHIIEEYLSLIQKYREQKQRGKPSKKIAKRLAYLSIALLSLTNGHRPKEAVEVFKEAIMNNNYSVLPDIINTNINIIKEAIEYGFGAPDNFFPKTANGDLSRFLRKLHRELKYHFGLSPTELRRIWEEEKEKEFFSFAFKFQGLSLDLLSKELERMRKIQFKVKLG